MKPLLADAIEQYHDLLSDELAGESQAALDAALQRRGLFFGKRPLCTVLRPRFLTAGHYRFLRERCALLLRAFGQAYRAARTNDAVRCQFGLAEWEEELIRHDPGFPDPSPTSRIDAFYLPDEGVLKVTEYNAETPAGAAYGDALADVFLALPVMRQFLRRFDVRPLLARHGVFHALLAAYRAWNGGRTAPRIAVLDWRDVPTYSEFLLFQEYFRAQGLEAVIADPRDAELVDGRLVLCGGPVDLIYKRVLISELVERCGRDHAVIKAVQSGAVCMVNSFRCKILHKKASLAVLSDERNAGLFSDAERSAIVDHIPWTRMVAERMTTHEGRSVDLVPFVLSQRERLVLKPNDEYGGKGIVLGWDVDAAAWEQAVRAALAEPYVVQERISIPSERYPSVADGRLVFADRILDTNPYACGGSYVEGCLSRLSTAALVNVTAGGGSQVPTFLVEPR
ncbi:MAG TPA: circularly permuted type 2 ATP-grasp protein [Gemmatimonadales bacterium]|nr:circularly permuted type 2 ATP-grasp protein [Gemmatimonadales bacterium]